MRLTGGSCATPTSNVACWAGSRPCPGSSPSEGTAAASGCRSPASWMCRLCWRESRERGEGQIRTGSLSHLGWTDQRLSGCRRPVCSVKWWVGIVLSSCLGSLSDNVFTIHVLSPSFGQTVIKLYRSVPLLHPSAAKPPVIGTYRSDAWCPATETLWPHFRCLLWRQAL